MVAAITKSREQLAVPPPLGVRAASAGLAGCIADCITFPLDLAKVRLQVQGEGTEKTGDLKSTRASFKYRGIFQTILTVSREEGPKSLYNGIVPGLHRQMCFCGVRIGLYDTVRAFYFTTFLGSDDSKGGGHVLLRILAGVTTGGLAVLCAQPTDVVKVRMQAALPGEPKRYTGAINAYKTIGRSEGVKGLWKGTLPNVARNSIVNAAELVSYDLIKTKIVSLELLSDNMPCHFVSAFGAGFCTTVIASPVDVVKTRFMNSPPGKYQGAIHCAVLMAREAGIYTFYKGFMPSFIRMASWNICMFVSFEQLKRGFMTFLNTPHVESQQRHGSRTIPST